MRETYHLGLKTWSRERNIFIPESKTKTHYLTLKLVSKKHKLPLESEPDKEICPGPKIRDTSLITWGAGLLNVGGSCMTEADCGATDSESKIHLYWLHWLFGTHSLCRDILLSLGGVKSSGPASKPCARLCWLPMGSLKFSEEWMGNEVGGFWREQEDKKQWELGLVCKTLKDRVFSNK